MLIRLLSAYPASHLVPTRLHDGHASLPDPVRQQPPKVAALDDIQPLRSAVDQRSQVADSRLKLFDLP
jgi:hypothetical protein